MAACRCADNVPMSMRLPCARVDLSSTQPAPSDKYNVEQAVAAPRSFGYGLSGTPIRAADQSDAAVRGSTVRAASGRWSSTQQASDTDHVQISFPGRKQVQSRAAAAREAVAKKQRAPPLAAQPPRTPTPMQPQRTLFDTRVFGLQSSSAAMEVD